MSLTAWATPGRFIRIGSPLVSAGAVRGSNHGKSSSTNCWWGTTNPTLIDGSIYDRKDNSTVGVVDYTPYLEGPWRDAGGVANYSTGLIKSLFK